MALDEEIKKIKGYLKKAFRPHPVTDETAPLSVYTAEDKLRNRGNQIDEAVRTATSGKKKSS